MYLLAITLIMTKLDIYVYYTSVTMSYLFILSPHYLSF